jgi:predicted transcriptional regulator
MAVTSRKTGVGTAIRVARKAAGMTLADVSRTAGVSVPYLSNVENGNAHPSAKWVHMVIEVIGNQLEDVA